MIRFADQTHPMINLIRSFLLISASFFFQETALCQPDNYYNYLNLGDYSIGYQDTLLFDDSLTYSNYGYSGKAPLFVRIWHPLKKSSSDFMSVEDFYKTEVPKELNKVYEVLYKHIDSAIVEYNISEHIKTWKPLTYKNHTHFTILDTLKNTSTKAVKSKLNLDGDFPVVLYHHGNQGSPFENYFMAEYFASQGYIFVAANFEIPYENQFFGYRPGNLAKPNTSFPKRVIQFCNEISTTNEVYYIGHSYGAQVGFSFLYEEPRWADAFVSMETTMEFQWPFKSVEYLKERWPVVYQRIYNHQKEYSIPMLMMANTKADPPMTFVNKVFPDLSANPLIQASAKKEFSHEGYTSIHFLRMFYKKRFRIPDYGPLSKQFKMYLQHLKLIFDFIDGIHQKKELNLTQYEKHFYLDKRR